MSTLYVSDTHSLLWYLARDDRLGAGARTSFDQVASGDAKLVVPMITIAELVFRN